MFDNEKIYIKEIKTVTYSENRVEKRTPVKSTVTFGLAASVYGKMVGCYFGGSYPYRSFAVSQPYKAIEMSKCYFADKCESLPVKDVTPIENESCKAADILNSTLIHSKKLEEIQPYSLVKWEHSGKHPVLCKNDTDYSYAKGDGSREKPYIIATADDFIVFTNAINNYETFEGKHFRQVNDIDLSHRTDYNGTNGSGLPYMFNGIYDGCGHVINIALDTTDRRCNNTVFPYTFGIIMNLGITGSILSDGRYISGFVRSIQKKGCMVNCYSLVNIRTSIPLDINYELRYYTSGKAHVKYKKHIFDIKEGSVLYIPKISGISEQYTEEISEPCNSISIYFDTDFPLSDELFVKDLSETKDAKTLFTRMYKTWLGRKNKYYLSCMSMIYEIIAGLSKPTGNYIPEGKYLKIEKGVTYLYNNCFNKDIDFYYPAELCGISYTYFKQLFIQKYDRAPKKQIMYLRMERAVELIGTGSCSITEIADKCGFENVYYFSKAFKKYYGVSPKNYISQ